MPDPTIKLEDLLKFSDLTPDACDADLRSLGLACLHRMDHIKEALTEQDEWLPIEIKGITLGENLRGKITDQEALDLVNTVIRSQISILNGDYEIMEEYGDSQRPQPPEGKA